MVALSLGLEALQNGFAAAVLVLQHQPEAVGSRRIVAEVELIQPLKHSLADLGHGVEPFVI